MKKLLILLLSISAYAQSYIGTRYGTGTPDYMNTCGQIIWHSPNIYAFGSARIGNSFNYMCVRRSETPNYWCPTDQAFFHIVMIGAVQTNNLLPASMTNTYDSNVYNIASVVAFGTLNSTNVEYVYPQQIPLDSNLIGLGMHSQWALLWIDVNSQHHVMLSQGHVVTVIP